MGLDVALGVVVLVLALRGWFRGFFAQAIRLGGLVGAIYAAGPLRDLVRPAVAERLGSMPPEVLDRILWWGSSAVAFVLITGTAGMMLSSYQRRKARERTERGLPNPGYRGDQSAGFLLGAAKGLIVVAVLAAGIAHYAPDYLKAGGWVGDQVGTSKALALSERYQPARRLWEVPAVQDFVAHVRRMGIEGPASTVDRSEGKPRAVAVDDRPRSRPAPLEIGRGEPSSGLSEADLKRALDEVRRDLERLNGPPG